jgi:hypothetical protein
MKIYVLDSFYPTGVDFAAERAEVVRWDDPQVKNWHEDADGLMVRMSRITADDMARAKKLRVIAKQGVGDQGRAGVIEPVSARPRDPSSQSCFDGPEHEPAEARAKAGSGDPGPRTGFPLARE